MRHLINLNESRILDNAGDRVPLGLLSIASTWGNTKVFDLNHMTEESYMETFEADKPSLVGISVYTSASYPEAIDLASKLEGRTRLMAGGHHATHMPETLRPYFDEVIQGEGEFYGRSVSMPELKPIDFSLINLKDYDVNDMQTLITSRGCVGNCAFCGKMTQHVKYATMGNISRELDQLDKGVYFLDDIFTFDKVRMEQVLSRANRPNRITTRANLFDEARADIARAYGTKIVSFGIESGDDEVLKRCSKGITTEQNYVAVSLASERGLETKGFFIIGLPGETEKSARKTINFSRTLREYAGLTKADFYFLTPFPGTAIWKNPGAYGIKINDMDYTKYLEAGKGAKCVVDTEELKASRIEELVQEAQEIWKN